MIKIDLFSIWQDEEKRRGKKLTALEVSAATGIHRNTLSSYLKGNVKSPNFEILNALCRYFNVEPGPVPFLIYTED